MSRVAFVLFAVLSLAMLPRRAASQGATVSGVVVQTAGGAPINGATVRLAGLPPATTRADGRFTINGVGAGRYTLTAQAVGFRVNAFALTIAGDTTLRVALERLPVQLDTVVVRARNLTIDGHVRDATTHTRLLDAQVTVFPGDRTVGAKSGGFRVTEVARGEITIVVDGFQHLPKEITFVANKDTSLTIDLDIDSVAIAMTAVQAMRLQKRANAMPTVGKSLTREEIRSSGTLSVLELLHRRYPKYVPDTARYAPSDVGPCVFYDDSQVEFDYLAGIPMETVERIEVFGREVDMIRVYTTKYVSSLAREPQLPRIMLSKHGRQRLCR